MVDVNIERGYAGTIYCTVNTINTIVTVLSPPLQGHYKVASCRKGPCAAPGERRSASLVRRTPCKTEEAACRCFAASAPVLQANGRDILGANCTVSLASSMPALDEGLGRENVSDQASGGEDKAR